MLEIDAVSRRLKISGWISEFSGRKSCIRISANSTAASATNVSAVAMYIWPTTLWSALVARSIQPGRVAGTPRVTTSGRGGASLCRGRRRHWSRSSGIGLDRPRR